MPIEIVRPQLEALAPFYAAPQREELRSFYEFPVIWHEASYAFAAMEGERMVGAGTLLVAASLGVIHRLTIDPAHRRKGIARTIVEQMADVANYYNCHKMTAMVPHERSAQRFLEKCGYGVEAVLPQHTFKLDMAMMRRYLL